jgi:glycosyltransferase involved in cell wall biosynthesis
MENKNAIFFLASSKNIGLTSHFSTQVVDMYEYGRNNGWDLYIMSDSKEQNEGLWEHVEQNIPKEFIVNFDENKILSIIEDIINISTKYKENIIHVQGLKQVLFCEKYLKNFHIVTTIHSFRHGNRIKRILFSCYYSIIIKKHVDKAIFITPYSWHIFSNSNILFRSGKIVHIPFCINSVLSTEYPNEIISSDTFNIVYFAQFHKHKQHNNFINAFITFVKCHSNVKVYFFGDGSERKSILLKIEKENLSDKIICPGRVHRKYLGSILQKANIGLLLSASETFGHAALEPIMMNVPLISTRVGFAEYFIQDYINGIGIETPHDLENALEYYYANPEACKKFATNAKSMASHLFDYSNMISAYFNLYSDILIRK